MAKRDGLSLPDPGLQLAAIACPRLGKLPHHEPNPLIPARNRPPAADLETGMDGIPLARYPAAPAASAAGSPVS